jgi:hypothetical protein
MQTAPATVENEVTSAAIETFQLAVVTTKNVRTKYDIEVAKRTLAVEDIQAMTEAELHDAHGHAVVATVSSFINRVRLLPEIKKRIDAGKSVGGCSTFKSYVIMYKDTGDTVGNAVRKAYYALHVAEKKTGQKLVKNKQGAGRKPTVKPEPNRVAVEEGIRREAYEQAKRDLTGDSVTAFPAVQAPPFVLPAVAPSTAASGTVTETFYTLIFDGKIPADLGTRQHFETLAEAQKFAAKHNKKNNSVIRSVAKVEATYTVTPCTPPEEPSPKPAKKAKNPETREERLDKLHEKQLLKFAKTVCNDCYGQIAPPVDGIKHGRIDQCEECGLKSEVETVIGVPVTDGKTDYAIEIGLPSEGYGESLKHSQKGLS